MSSPSVFQSTCFDSCITDALDVFFVVALSILLLVVYISSGFDERIRVRNLRLSKIQREPEEHYKKELNVLSKKTKNDIELEHDNRSTHVSFSCLVHKFLVAFSFRRNWYLLSAPIKHDMRDLRSISAIRIWTMIAIFYGHCSWFCIAVPISNPIYVERV